MPDFDWNNRKNRKNKKVHNADFETASRIWDGFVVERPDERFEYGEERVNAFGTVDGRVLAVTYTLRGADVYRLISARKATSDEREGFEEEFRRAQPPPA
jgi:uncharacterized DUF497 family protein